MAAEDIGNVYKTKIPGYDDTADIQAALKLFHYGSETVPTEDEIKGFDGLGEPLNPLNYPNGIEPNSLAGHIKYLDYRLTDQETLGTGSDYYPTITETGEILTSIISPVDGQIAMVNLTNGAPVETNYASAFYLNEAPTEDLVNGMLWIDKDSEAKDVYVYDLATTTWVLFNSLKSVIEAKGDILIGISAGNIDNLAIGSNGTVLTADDTQPLGVKWQQVDTESIIISSVMGAY